MPDAVGIIPLPPQQPYVSGNFTPPTLSDRLIGSPLGRFTHDAVVSPMETLAQNVLLGSPLAPMLQPGIDAGVGGIENAYQDALTANRNTPGYAAARNLADQVTQNMGQNFGDQMFSSYLPSLAGVSGLAAAPFKGVNPFDLSNAMADARSAAQDAYAAANPGEAAAADLAGSFAPSVGLGQLPKLAGDAIGAMPPIKSLLNASPALSDAASDAGQIGAILNKGTDWLNRLFDVSKILNGPWQQPDASQPPSPPPSSSFGPPDITPQPEYGTYGVLVPDLPMLDDDAPMS
jgi:hypothetical protein